jgi:uncharacterized protein YjbI with pentapeptide repeats
MEAERRLLYDVLFFHSLYVEEDGKFGERAYLRDANLSGANLSGAEIRKEEK